MLRRGGIASERGEGEWRQDGHPGRRGCGRPAQRWLRRQSVPTRRGERGDQERTLVQMLRREEPRVVTISRDIRALRGATAFSADAGTLDVRVALCRAGGLSAKGAPCSVAPRASSDQP